MISYGNYFGVYEQSDPKAYEIIKSSHFDPMIKYITGIDDPADAPEAELEAGAEAYLLSSGMTKDEIRRLKEILTQQ